MALPLDRSNEEYFEYDSSSEISALSFFSSNTDDDDDEDVEAYTLEEGMVPVRCDLKSVVVKLMFLNIDLKSLHRNFLFS